MRRRIVIGHDGSEQANDALTLGTGIALGTGAAVTVAYIYRQEPSSERQDRVFRRELRDRTVDKLAPALDRAPDGVEVDSGAFPSTTTAHGLRDLALEERADLIVIGSTHYGALGRVLIGSVGELLCSDAPCAVAVAPRNGSFGANGEFRRIGVAFDGTPESATALTEAAALAEALGAQLTALTVIKPSRSLLRSGERRAESDARNLLADTLEQLGAGIEADHELLRGDPVERLSEAGESLDMLVMGSRGYGPIRHALLGGVSGRMMRVAPCPIVVTPKEARPMERRASAGAGSEAS